MWKIPTSTDCLTLLDGSGDFNMLISELLRLAMVIQSPLQRVQVYIYIYMRIMLFIHIMFVLIVFNTCIYIKIYRKYILQIISIQKGLKDLPLIHIAKRPTQKLQVSWGCICCFLFQSEAQRSKGMGTWPDIQQSQVQVHCFAELWEAVICCG